MNSLRRGIALGKFYREPSSTALLTLHGDFATVPVDYLLYYRKAQTRTTVLAFSGIGRPEELLEYVFNFIGRYSNSRIANINLNKLATILRLKRRDSSVIENHFAVGPSAQGCSRSVEQHGAGFFCIRDSQFWLRPRQYCGLPAGVFYFGSAFLPGQSQLIRSSLQAIPSVACVLNLTVSSSGPVP